MYLLGVLSEDKTQEITSVVNLISQYQNLPSTLPSELTSALTQIALSHHTRRFFNPTYAGLITSLTAETPSLAPIPGEGKSHARDVTISVPLSSTSTETRPSGSSKKEEGELNTLRSQYSRFLPPPPSAPPTRNGYISTALEVLGKYYHIRLNRRLAMTSPTERHSPGTTPAPPGGGVYEDILHGAERDWVYLVTPFVCCLSRPGAICLGFEKLMDRLGRPRSLFWSKVIADLSFQIASHLYRRAWRLS